MKHILLVNPWITDFTAYDFWLKPLGLLSIASILRENSDCGLLLSGDRFILKIGAAGRPAADKNA